MQLDRLEAPMDSSIVRAPIGAIVEHWINARIDSPGALIERLDGAAKQMIAVGGFLQTAYLGFIAFGDIRGHAPWPLILLPFASLVFAIGFAAAVVCAMPLSMDAYASFRLMQRGIAEIEMPALDEAFKRWCEDIDSLAARKRRRLHIANWAFTITAIGTFLLVTTLVN